MTVRLRAAAKVGVICAAADSTNGIILHINVM